MYIVGPLPAAPKGVCFLLVITDYFTKWVETAAYAKIRQTEVVDFIWRYVICHFGTPKEIVMDNGPQFIGQMVTRFLEDLHIKRITSSPYHPVTNGQAESTNKVIIESLKKRLEPTAAKLKNFELC